MYSPLKQRDYFNLTLNQLVLSLLMLCIFIIACGYIFFMPYLKTVVEEHHYLLISWNIWVKHEWIVLYDNKGIYLNKPPLTFWLTNLIWHITSPNNWVFRIIPALFTGGTLLLTYQIVKILWPQHQQRAWIAPLMLLGSFEIMRYVPMFTHDPGIVFFVTLATYSLVLSGVRQYKFAWIIFGGTVGLGILTKGPIILIFTVPPAILAPYFFKNTQQTTRAWWGRLTLSLVLSGIIVAGWLVPLVHKLGFAYVENLLFPRILGSQHFYTAQARRPWWIYFKIVPSNLLPWTLWPLLYVAIGRQIVAMYKKTSTDVGIRFVLTAFIVIFIIMTLIESKASRYIMPILLYAILFLSYCLMEYSTHNKWLYPNWPLIFLVLASSIIALTCLPFAPHLFKHMHYADLVKHFIPGIIITGVLMLGIGLMVLFKRSSTLTASLLQQFAIIFVIMLCYSFFFLKTRMDLYGFPAFQTCVADYYAKAKQTPVAFTYKYGGYRYNITGAILPDGVYLKANEQLAAWLAQHPDGLVISELDAVDYPDKEVICRSSVVEKKQLMLWRPTPHPQTGEGIS